MISEFEVLVILTIVSEARGGLGRDEVRAATILASLASGQYVRFDQMLDAIIVLQRRGFLEGDMDGPDGLRITLEGAALVEALGERKIGGTHLTSLKVRAEPLRGGSTVEFIKTFGPQVTELVKAQRTKFSAPPGEIILCALLLPLEGVDVLHETDFELPREFQAQESNPWPEIHRTEAHLLAKLGKPVHLSIVGGKLLAVAPGEVHSLEVGGHVLTRLGSRVLDPGAWGPYIVAAAEGFFVDRLATSGYLAVGSRRRVFVRYGERGGEGMEASVPALRLFYQVLGPHHLLVWVEEFSKPWTRALDLMAGAHSKEEMAASLGGQSLRTLPYERPATLLGVIPAVDLARELVPSTPFNYMDYWSDLGVELEERTQPLLVMQTKTGEYHYPAETVLVRSEAPELLGGREPAVLSPEDRLEGLRTLAALIFDDGPREWGGVHFLLDRVAPAVGDIPPDHRPRVAVINPPLLRFAEGAISSDPLDVFSKGPEAGRKRVVIRDLYYPAGADPDRCARAVEALCRHYGARGLGEARLDPDAQRVGYSPSARRTDIGGLVRRTSGAKGPESAGIAFLEEGDDAYHGFKRFYPEYTEAPIQAIQVETAAGMLAGRRGLLDQLGLNLYLKKLGTRESPWTLLAPADRVGRTSYLALAFSRRLDPKRGGKGVAALHDAVGRGLNWGLVMTPGERTITQAWFETVLEQVQPLLEGDPSDRLVLYRSGRLDPVEIAAIGKALAARMGTARRIDFVSVMNEHRRFFLRSREGVVNPPPGTVIFWSDGEALLAESGFAERGIWRGTVVPVGLKRVLGSSPMDLISSEYHDLTHLSWSAPSTTWKHPLVMKVAERLAEAAREGVPSSAIKSLPL